MAVCKKMNGIYKKDYEPYQTMGRILRIPKRSGDVLFYDQSRRGAIEGVRSAFADIRNFNGISLTMPGVKTVCSSFRDVVNANRIRIISPTVAIGSRIVPMPSTHPPA